MNTKNNQIGIDLAKQLVKGDYVDDDCSVKQTNKRMK